MIDNYWFIELNLPNYNNITQSNDFFAEYNFLDDIINIKNIFMNKNKKYFRK